MSGPARRIEVELLAAETKATVGRGGAVRSAQEARLNLNRDLLDRLWNEPGLTVLARSYWGHLRRSTAGAVRVRYGAHTRRLVLLTEPLTLLRFRQPEYRIEPQSASINWQIMGGLLVARAGRGSGHLRLTLTRESEPYRVLLRSEIADYHPRLGGQGPLSTAGGWLYSRTQLRFHDRITRSFLRSVADLGELLPPRAD